MASILWSSDTAKPEEGEEGGIPVGLAASIGPDYRCEVRVAEMYCLMAFIGLEVFGSSSSAPPTHLSISVTEGLTE
jgi:hypothetical protein